MKVIQSSATFVNPYIGVPQGAGLSPLQNFIFFLDFLRIFETKLMCADDSTSLCFPFESVTENEIPEEFCKATILADNRTKFEQILLKTAETSAKCPPTEVAEVFRCSKK